MKLRKGFVWVPLFLLLGCKMAGSNAELDSQIGSASKNLVFLLGGQSNMAGQTPLDDSVRSLKLPNVEVFCAYPYKFEKDREEYKKDQGFPAWKPFEPCGASPKDFGPEATFAQSMAKALPDTKIFLIKYAHGGTSQACEWQPNKPSSAFASYGEEACKKFLSSSSKELDSMRSYERFLKVVGWGMDALKKRGIQAEIGGMLWFQGEADADGRAANKFLSDTYATNLPHFIKSVRADLGQNNMPFVLGKIKCGYSNAEWDSKINPLEKVRKVQQDVTKTESKVFAFDTMNLKFQADGCHFDQESMKKIGASFAETFLK